MPAPLVSVIIPTFNRAEFLSGALSSLEAQTVPREDFQVVVIDDGSTDETREVVQSFEPRLNLRYLCTSHAGLAAAKDAGIKESAGSILVFADDDDQADAHLLEEHLKSHGEHPEENIAVLGYTGWASHVRPSLIMQCLPDIHDSPFVYKDLVGGEMLDFMFFWGGRSSCKKSLLDKYGVFDSKFVWGEEDIELGLRLEASAGLVVLFNRNALSLMARPLTFESMCTRSESQGRSMFQLSLLGYGARADRYLKPLLKDPTTWRPLQLDLAVSKWQEIEPLLDLTVARIHKMETGFQSGMPRQKRDFYFSELRGAYWWALWAHKVKGFAHAMCEVTPTLETSARGATGSSEASLAPEMAAQNAILRERESYTERLEQHLESLWQEIAWREDQIRRMEGTRFWRLGSLYWKAESNLRGLFGSGRRKVDSK